ncbi:hypothetical protein BJ165DRAFT_940429 [Panaeolus papilionaceus]|nr:hypothetical protein BJ165DRAFT_940429 [Panaeolus papilionaceus]
MRKAVTLAMEVRRKRLDHIMCVRTNVRIALSLGPFGATLNPTQEFNGFYPPPYGPKGYAEGDVNMNSFTHGMDEILAVKELASFHFDRLQIFASDDTWSSIHCIAIETVPLVREVVAIREAFNRLHEYLRVSGKPLKPWWISFVFPDAIPVQQNICIFDYVQGAVALIPSVSTTYRSSLFPVVLELIVSMSIASEPLR